MSRAVSVSFVHDSFTRETDVRIRDGFDAEQTSQ